ncbi:MAG: DeoR/GlpR transcriptional regulator, partial [Acutalibacter sp.]|nr:DeoR/GlpR transcriptional regulator [Acutalibacter sp.]
MKERETKILELLAKEKRLEVAALAQVLGVSSVTVRKDLDTLEEKGVLRREHGYALLKSEDDLSSRLAYHYACKGRIAKRAAALVADGETVMIESGSCCALLAEEICTSRRDVTIVTNSAFIAGFVRQKPHAHVVLLGGVYQNDAQVMVGPLVAQGA